MIFCLPRYKEYWGNNTLNDQQQYILVTGAASGIGAAFVRQIARPGLHLTLHTRRSKKSLDAVAKAAEKAGAVVHTSLGDLAAPETPAQLIESHTERYGKLDQLVANAGFPLFSDLDNTRREDMQYAFSGNCMSFIALAQAARPLLRASACGRLVAVGSFTAHVFRPDMPQFPASAASKGALETAVRSLSLALAQEQITVNAVIPGYIRKDKGTGDGLSEAALQDIVQRIPLARLGEPADVAQAIAFLCSPQAAYITGQTLHVNGGLI